jgi:putative intracellular protease/amidase
MPHHILVVITSNDKLGETGKKTGVWLEEIAAPYLAFKDAGHTVTLASPKGGQPPIDPGSEADGAQTDATRRFKADAAAVAALAATHALAEVAPGAAQKFDAVFYPGGHGGLWDLAADATSIALIEAFASAGKPVGAVCHGPAVLVACKKPDGKCARNACASSACARALAHASLERRALSTAY